MNLKSIPILLTALAVLHTGCEPEPKPPPQERFVDEELRGFLGIHTLGGCYELPTGTTGYFPGAIFFLDGREVARATGMLRGDHSVRSGEIQLLWQREPGKEPKAALVEMGSPRDVTDFFPFWDDFDSTTWSAIRPTEMVEYRGIRLCGIVAANPKGGKFSPGTSLFGGEVSEKMGKYVILVGVDSDTDRDRLEERFSAPSANRKWEAPQ